jgi:plasmid maintenance system antidote protein VapI
LRRASQAETSAERAAVARERASRLVREGRRLDEVGRRVSAEVPAAHDSWRAVHDLRIESLKRAAEAEHGAERVAMLREKAARLLSEQRRLETEMAKQLAQRTR